MSDKIITRETMFEPLLIADPSFQKRWQDFQAEWADEAELPLYLALDSLAEHLLQRLSAEDTSTFPAVFMVVERWHTGGDAYVSEAATIGLLESLQGLSGGNNRKAVTVEPWLGPVTRRWWDKLDRYWEGDGKALRFDN